MIKGWSFVINIPPKVYKDFQYSASMLSARKVTGAPIRAVEPEDQIEYKWQIKNAIEDLVDSPFRCKVKVEAHFYMPSKRVAYPTAVAHLMAKCMVPYLVEDPRLITEFTSRIHYNERDDKTWKPRTELIIYPLIEEV